MRVLDPWVLIGWVLLLTVSACQSTKENWNEINSNNAFPTLRHECGFIEEGGKFDLLGGRGVKPVGIFDPAFETWSQGVTPPVEIHHFQPIAFNGYIIVLGAMTGAYPREQPLSNMLIYQPLQYQWFVGDTIPRNRNRG
jgi:hypothetical protein